MCGGGRSSSPSMENCVSTWLVSVWENPDKRNSLSGGGMSLKKNKNLKIDRVSTGMFLLPYRSGEREEEDEEEGGQRKYLVENM